MAGTKVRVTARSNRPLRGGSVKLELDKQTIDIGLNPPQTDAAEVEGEFTLTAAGKFSLEIVDVAGQPSQTPFGGSITIVQDQRPFVRILEPQQQSLATPTAVLPIQFSAEDDYGVARLQLYRSLNDSPPRPLDIAVGSPPRRRMPGQVQLPLQEYGLSPGDEIKLFARVEDNDPAGAKGAESAVVTIRIISQEEFEKMLRFRQGLEVLLNKYEQARRRIENLTEKMEALQKELAKEPADSPAAEELKKKIAELAEQMQKEANAIEQSAEHVLPYDIDEKLSSELKKLAEALREAAKATDELAKKDGLKNGEGDKELSELLKKLKQDRGEFEKQALEPLEHLAKVFPLLALQSRFVILVARQTDLADRIAALKGKDGADDPKQKVRLRELEEEQKANRKELFEILRDIAENANKLPDEPAFQKLKDTAWKFVEDVQASGAEELMSEAEVALAEFLPTHAHKKADEAAEILRAFIKRAEELGGDCESCLGFRPSLGEAMGNSLAQMLAEMGLGTGAGSGYSARRGAGEGVGLYGGMPGLSGNPAGRAGGSRNQDKPGGRSGQSQATDDSSVDRSGDSDDGSSAAAGQASAPARYRRRVGRYLQRIAEEAEAP